MHSDLTFYRTLFRGLLFSGHSVDYLLLRTGWAKNRTVFMKICNSRICSHRIAFYISNCSAYPQ